MPYIKQGQRRYVMDMPLLLGDNPGELNYVITKICHHYILNSGICYKTLNEVIGVLECAKMELYRTVIAGYEDKKCNENGSVSKLDEA